MGYDTRIIKIKLVEKMGMNHAVSELISCIKNGQMARKSNVVFSLSKLKKDVLGLLKKEGYIKDFKVVKEKDDFEKLNVELSYYEGKPVIKDIKVLSKPGRRMYCKVDDIPRIYNGLGMIILSTPKGIIFDYEAKQLNVGGELLLKIF